MKIKLRPIHYVSSIDDLPRPGLLSGELRDTFHKLEFDLPSGGYLRQDNQASRTDGICYPLDIPMLDEIRRQAVGTHLEEHLRDYSGECCASIHYELLVDEDNPGNQLVALCISDSRVVSLGELLWILIGDRIVRVGRVIQVARLTLDDSDKAALDSRLRFTLIPQQVFEVHRGKKVISYVATDFIEVDVPIDRNSLIGEGGLYVS